jgi:hypothetical protein
MYPARTIIVRVEALAVHAAASVLRFVRCLGAGHGVSCVVTDGPVQYQWHGDVQRHAREVGRRECVASLLHDEGALIWLPERSGGISTWQQPMLSQTPSRALLK